MGYESEAVPTNSSSDEHNNAAGPVGVTGSGSSTSSSTSVVVSHGTLFGTRLKLSNTWKSTSVTSVIVDGRVSLCGCFFFGTLLDSKSNKSSTIEGVKIQHAPYKYSLNLYTRSVLAKASLVSTMACSKLAANLVIGLNPNPDDDVSADVDAGMDVVAITNDAKSSGDADASAAATGANTHPNPKDKAGTDLRKWVSSTLFRAGCLWTRPCLLTSATKLNCTRRGQFTLPILLPQRILTTIPNQKNTIEAAAAMTTSQTIFQPIFSIGGSPRLFLPSSITCSTQVDLLRVATNTDVPMPTSRASSSPHRPLTHPKSL